MNKVYETNRLVLKVLDEKDANIVLEYYLRNKDFLEEWEAKKSEEYYTLNYHKKMLQNDYSSFIYGDSLRFWIFKKEDLNNTIGSVGFNNIIRGAFLSCHLGYKLDKDEINNGFITEAIEKGIEIVFKEYGLHRIEANIMPKNKRSLRVVEKLGFYDEGLAKKYLKINDKWEDHIHMVLLNEELE